MKVNGGEFYIGLIEENYAGSTFNYKLGDVAQGNLTQVVNSAPITYNLVLI